VRRIKALRPEMIDIAGADIEACLNQLFLLYALHGLMPPSIFVDGVHYVSIPDTDKEVER
jgi:hypothetical protein